MRRRTLSALSAAGLLEARGGAPSSSASSSSGGGGGIFGRLLGGGGSSPAAARISEAEVGFALENTTSDVLRRLALSEGRRVDGRGAAELRPLVCVSRPVPAVHGSGLFERGDTQALCTATVGVERSAQALLRAPKPTDRRLVLHYRRARACTFQGFWVVPAGAPAAAAKHTPSKPSSN